MEVKRGDVVICAAPADYGKPRPAVVVQSDLFNDSHSSVVVCLITSHLADAPLFRIPVPAGRTTGLKLESQVMVDKVMAIPRNKITGRAGALPAVVLKEVDHALRLWLELA
jgi:mRNA interferase MazF